MRKRPGVYVPECSCFRSVVCFRLVEEREAAANMRKRLTLEPGQEILVEATDGREGAVECRGGGGISTSISAKPSGLDACIV